ncbi:MAG: VanZ family protein [Actinobacteria bacterium]|nr:VanZ family protein [Actinomycetota bacterium]
MEQVLRSVRPLLPLIPLGLGAVISLIVILGCMRTRRGMDWRAAYWRAAVDTVLIATVISIMVLTLPPSIGAPRTINLVPFEELQGSVGDNGLSQLLGNAILFIPLGLVLPWKWVTLRTFARTVMAGIAFSAAIEVAQFILPTGRQTSVTDVIMNAIGTAFGFFVFVGTASIRSRGKATTTG